MHIYDCPNKRAACDEIYRYLKVEAPGPILILPGGTRGEVDTALASGFPLDRIALVERDYWIMANFTRRFSTAEKKQLWKFRNDLDKVCKTLVESGTRIHAANLDFCSPIEPIGKGSARDEIEKFLRSGVIESGRLCVEVFQGRVKGFFGTEERLGQLGGVIRRSYAGHVELVGTGTYVNSVSKASSSMLWAVYQLGKKEKSNAS